MLILPGRGQQIELGRCGALDKQSFANSTTNFSLNTSSRETSRCLRRTLHRHDFHLSKREVSADLGK